MGLRRVAFAGALVASVFLVAPHGAQAAAFDPGDFTVRMNSAGTGAGQTAPVTTCSAGSQSTDLQGFLTNVAAKWNGQGQAPVASCTSVQSSTFTNTVLEGTVSNVNIGDGTISQTCDMRRTVSIAYSLTVAAGSPNTVTVGSFSNSLDGFQACAWAMRFNDAKSSRLSGTIEQSFAFSGTGTVPCSGERNPNDPNLTFCVEVVADAKVWVTGGAGQFADTGGTGSFSSSSTAPIVVPGTQGVKVQSLRAGVLVRMLLDAVPAAGSSDTANSLKMSLLKGARASVRMVSPASQSGTRTLGAGADGSGLTTVKLSAAPGAKCGLTAKSGRKSKVLLSPKADADGMIGTSITSATLKAKLSVATGARVILSVYCAAAKKTASSNQTVTVGA